MQKLPDVAEAQRCFNYPYAAVEEALSNAVYHKGYDIREPIEVRVLPDRMEILSHPGADRSISMEGLKNYRAVSRRYRNRRIGEFLKELHLTEGRNTGFQKIIRALKANGSPMPTFETDDARSYFLTTIGIHPAFTVSNDSANDNVNDTVSDQLSENEQRILAIIRENGDLSISAMAEMLGISYSTVSRALKGLKGKNWIRRDGSDKRGRWMVAR